MKPFLVSLTCCVLTANCDARILIGTHPGMFWLRLSPDGRWLDSGSASNEIGYDVPTWRYDLRHGGYTNRGYDYGYTWLSNGLVADTAGTEDDDIKTSIGMEGQVAPVVSLSRPLGTKPVRIYRDQMFPRDPYHAVRLSQNKRQLWIYSHRWMRRFDVRSGRLLDRMKWPISKGMWESTWAHISPDGRWFVARTNEPKSLVQLYGQDGRLRRTFPGRSDISGDDVWISPTLFALERKWTPAGKPDQERTSTEFYDAQTGRRLWVLADRVVREPVDVGDIANRKIVWTHSWRLYYLVPQQNSVIVCGENIWTWRDLRTGKILRQALRPETQALRQPFSLNAQVHGDFYYWADKKGRIWRERFRFIA